VAAGTYKALQQGKYLHWYCKGCSRGVVNTWKLI
jgi:septal ring factor EnvC (AmiA/AmiB activator)